SAGEVASCPAEDLAGTPSRVVRAGGSVSASPEPGDSSAEPPGMRSLCVSWPLDGVDKSMANLPIPGMNDRPVPGLAPDGPCTNKEPRVNNYSKMPFTYRAESHSSIRRETVMV